MTGVVKPVKELGLKVFVSHDVICLVDRSRLLCVDTIIADSLAGISFAWISACLFLLTGLV